MAEIMSFFEQEKAVPDPGLAKEEFPADFINTYKTSVNRVVIEYTDAETAAVAKMLGLEEIKKTVYHFGDLGK